MLFCRTKTSNFLVTHYLHWGIVICVYPIFCLLCSCSLLFFTAPHSHLAGRSLLAGSISHCLTAALDFHVFLPTKLVSFVFNHSLLLFLWSVIHVSVNIKNNVEKDTTSLLFFLSKSPSSHAISFQIKPWVTFGLLSYPKNPYALRKCALGPSCHVLTDLKSVNGVGSPCFDTPDWKKGCRLKSINHERWDLMDLWVELY